MVDKPTPGKVGVTENKNNDTSTPKADIRLPPGSIPNIPFPRQQAEPPKPKKKTIFNKIAAPLAFFATTALLSTALWTYFNGYNEDHTTPERKVDHITVNYTTTTGYKVQRSEGVFVAMESNTLTTDDMRDFANYVSNIDKMSNDALEAGMMTNLNRIVMLSQEPSPVKLKDGTVVYHQHGILQGLGGGPSMILPDGKMLWTAPILDLIDIDTRVVTDLEKKFIEKNYALTSDDARAVMAFVKEAKAEAARMAELARLAGDRLSVRDSLMSANRGDINQPFFLAAKTQGLPDGIVRDLIKLYSYNVDFQRDFDVGDRFDVIFEGSAGGMNNIAYAKLVVNNREMELYRYTDTAGNTDYYDANGRSIKTELMKTPIDGAHITSGFGMRRHPIGGYNRMHKGIDFAAPSGTPIYAAGDGVIEVREREGGYGNYIRIQHAGGYETGYGHMRGFSAEFKKGDRVQQGDVIGFVGSTGVSTGPHLHYEVMKDGKHINPSQLKPNGKGRELTGEDLVAFKLQVQLVQDQLGKLGFGPVFRGVVTRDDVKASKQISMQQDLNKIRVKAPGKHA